MSIISAIIGVIAGFFLAFIGDGIRYKRDRREKFLEVTAELRATLEQMRTNNPNFDNTQFYQMSVIKLAPAVHRVRKYAKNRERLDLIWKAYKSNQATNPKELMELMIHTDIAIGNVRGDDGYLPSDFPDEMLDAFDRRVAEQ